MTRRNFGISLLGLSRSQRRARRQELWATARESAHDPRSGKPRTPLAKILERYTVLPNGCHEWTGSRNEDGYGIVCLMIDGKPNTMGAHRLQWCHLRGKPAEGMDTLHECDHRPCINIDHLFEGTPEANIHDMIRKGRHNFTRLKYAGETAQESARLKVQLLDDKEPTP